MLGVGAAIAVAVFAGAAVVAPLSMPSAAIADEEFYQRIHQEFVPAEIETMEIELHTSPIEEKVEPKPVAAPVAASLPKYTGGGSPAEWMAAAGIAESDWGYVDYIVSRESGWNPNATNSSSGACGLVQALPCSKVPGSGYNPVDNLRWANGYAVGRYGSWQGAYNFWIAKRWW